MIQSFKDRWALYVFGFFGLMVTTIIVGRATGEPLVSDFGWLRALVAPFVPGLLSIVKGGVVAIGVLVLCLLAAAIAIPLRDWLEQEHNRRVAATVAKTPLKIKGYGIATPNPAPKPQTVIQVDPWQSQKEKRDYGVLYMGVLQLLDTHAGGHKAITVEGLLDELGQALARPKVAPSAADWRLVAGIVEWARAEETLRLRATRDAFRAARIAIPEADVQSGGAFNEWVKGLDTLSPIASVAPVLGVEQAKTDNGQEHGRTEEEAQEEPQEGREVQRQITRYIIPRGKRAKTIRDELT